MLTCKWPIGDSRLLDILQNTRSALCIQCSSVCSYRSSA